jgi:hypothetical protein
MSIAAVWGKERHDVPHIIRQLFLYIQENHAYIFGILYLVVCVMGVIYDNAIYYRTGVNPLLYFDLSDFLLSGLRHPLILVIPILLVFPIIFVHVALLRHKHYAVGMSLTYGFALLVALATPIFTAYMKIPGCGQHISIHFGKESSGTSFDGLLYSSTSKVLFVAEEPDSPDQSVVSSFEWRKPERNTNLIPIVGPTEQQPLKLEAILLDDIHQIGFYNTRPMARPGSDLLCVVFQ